MNAQIFQAMYYGLRLTHPKLVNVSARLPLAQAAVESAKWTSPLFLSTNNMFGMQHPSARQTASLGPNPKGYATYRSPLDSIRDYLLYLEAFEVYSDAALDTRLAAGKYAQDKNYEPKIQAAALAMQSQLIDPLTLGLKTAALVVVGLVGVKVAKKALK